MYKGNGGKKGTSATVQVAVPRDKERIYRHMGAFERTCHKTAKTEKRSLLRQRNRDPSRAADQRGGSRYDI